MKRLILLVLLIFCFSFSKEIKNTQKVDCVILSDENSIICKYMQNRVNFDKKVIFQWIDPDNKISRNRVMIIPSGDGSIYDFRYINGRKKGVWIFRVKDKDKVYETKFELK